MHSHILFGVDDGSESFEMSCQMIDDAVEAGISHMFATSHFIFGENQYTTEMLEERKVDLDIYIESKNYDFKLVLGHEVLIDNDIIQHIESGVARTLGKSRYVLVEFPMNDMPIYVESVIHELRIAGYIPIIAHPERNRKIIETPNKLFELLEKGALAQLNLKSLTGRFGKSAKETAEILLDNCMYHFVGSDVHRPAKDKPFMEQELSRLGQLVNGSMFDTLTEANPYAVLIDSEIITSTHRKYVPKSFMQQMLCRFRRQTA